MSSTPRTPSTSESKQPASKLRGVGLGIELAASLIGFALLGLWVDHQFGTGPWGTLISVVVGFIGGFYNFIRSSLRAMRAPSFPDPSSSQDVSPEDRSSKD